MPKTSNRENEKSKLPIRCVWGLICSLSSVDQKTNNISLFNIIENFTLPKKVFDEQEKTKKLINATIPYQVILLLKRLIDINISDEEKLLDLKIMVINPQGKILAENISSFKFLQGKQNMRVTIDMQGIVVDTAGLYLHKIEIKIPENNNFVEIYDIPFQVTSL